MFTSFNMYFSLLFSIFCAIRSTLAVVDYCETDQRNSSISTPGIQFTKELSSSEYAVVSSFKSLHCCAKGYRNIEWFKDGKPYPWGGDVSSFILYPESANQTIYSQSLSSVDAGNYTCTVANDSRQVSHTAALVVFDMRQNYNDIPLATYSLPVEQFVRLGQSARLYCEAFVGKIDLPDATSDVWWERPGFNMSSPLARRYEQRLVSREEKQVVGAYLFIEHVSRADLGEYVCSVSNTEDQVLRLSTQLREEEWPMEMPSHKIPWLKLQFLILSVLVVATMAIVYNRFALSVLLYFKLKFSQRPSKDGKEYDVLVCYSAKDVDFAVNVLATTLQNHYHYTVTLYQVNNATVSAEMQVVASLSRRLLIVLSPALLDNQWMPAAINPLLRQLSDLHSNVICLSLKPLQSGDSWKSEEGTVLRQLLTKCIVVEWHDQTPMQRRNVWTRLRLSLPTPSVASSHTEIPTTTTTKSKLSTLAKSNESLEVLV